MDFHDRSSPLSIDQDFFALEQLLLHPDIRRDRTRLTALIAEDFVEFGAAGLAWTREQVIAGLLEEAPVERVIDDFKARHLADSVVLVTYVCQHRYPEGRVSSSLRSSIWRQQAGGWQMVFHQGTRVQGNIA